MPLTNKEIQLAKPKEKAYKITDGEGMYLLVSPTGSKAWKLKYSFMGKEKKYSIGTYPHVTLKEARLKKSELKKMLSDGIDPNVDKKVKKKQALLEATNTFKQVAEEWYKTNLNKWSEAHGSKIWRRIELHLLPVLGSMPIHDIKPMDILNHLRQIEARGTTEISHRILQTCIAIFRYAIITERITYNPASDLKGALVSHQAEHYPTLTEKELPDFLKALEKVSTSRQNKIAVYLLMLTFVRTGEMRQSKWEHMDFKNKVWCIPSEITKMRREHIVPLSRQVVELLKELKEITSFCPYGYILPSQNRQKNPVMSENTINNIIKKMGYGGKLVGHGFRALASTILNEQGYRADVIERQLAHVPKNKIRAAYNRAQYIEERTTMMQEWADWLDAIKNG